MRIGIAFDLVPADRPDDGPDDRFEEFDKPETVDAIADAIRGAGHDVVLMGDGREFLRRALDDPPDFVFNIAEGEGTSRNREARVPAACEMLGIPYAGSDPLSLSAALDKEVARHLVRAWNLKVPNGFVWEPKRTATALGPALFEGFATYPIILKPVCEGSSKGIRGQCLADNPQEAAAICRRLHRDYRQPILIEEFIAGDEVTVGVIGDRPDAEIIGAMRISPREPSDRFVYSLEVKRDWVARVSYQAPAQLSSEIAFRLRVAAFAAFHALGCRDVARIDFRIKDGVPYFIEANPLPGLNPATSDLVILARGYGIEYNELIRRILNTALGRVGLLDREARAS